MAELDAILKRATDPSTGTIHGASFVAYNAKGELLYRGAAGSRTVDRSTNEPLTTQTLTWIASSSKLLTSVAAMQVVERGLVGLDDDIREILPQLKDLKVLRGFEGESTRQIQEPDFESLSDASRRKKHKGEKPTGQPIFEDLESPITLRQLLSHTSGFALDMGNPLLVKYSAWAGRTDNMFSGNIRGATHPLVFQPGTSWQYSSGTDWAGKVVEAASGHDLETFMQENIWKPVGAKSSTFYPAKLHGGDVEARIQETGDRGQGGRLNKIPNMWKLEPEDAMGAAGVYSTAEDYGLLLKALIQGGGPLLKAETVDLMLDPQTGPEASEALGRFCVSQTGGSSFAQSFVGRDADWTKIQGYAYSLCGIVAPEDVPGRRQKGSVCWGGLPGLVWTIDRAAGIAATFFTQITPPGDSKTVQVQWDLEEAVYKMVAGAH